MGLNEQLGWIGAATVALLSGVVSVGDVMLLTAAVVAAIVAWKRQNSTALRESNVDLTERNKMLESERVDLRAEIVELHARPNLEEHAHALRQVALILDRLETRTKEIHTAVVPPH